MKKELFQKKISSKDMSRWECPHCHKGRLKLGKTTNNDLTQTIPEEERNRHDEVLYQNIAGFLNCDYCYKKVFFIASRYYTHDSYIDPDGSVEIDEDEQNYYPYFFKPSLCIIELNEFIPEDIKSEMINSFSLYWVDISACANKLRTVLELIMSQQKIRKRHTSNSGKSKQNTLHKRIELFAKKKKSESEFIMALKYIGNAGSHTKKLTHEDILIGYEMLEHVLNKLYDKKYFRLKKRMQMINKRRGPVN